MSTEELLYIEKSDVEEAIKDFERKVVEIWEYLCAAIGLDQDNNLLLKCARGQNYAWQRKGKIAGIGSITWRGPVQTEDPTEIVVVEFQFPLLRDDFFCFTVETASEAETYDAYEEELEIDLDSEIWELDVDDDDEAEIFLNQLTEELGIEDSPILEIPTLLPWPNDMLYALAKIISCEEHTYDCVLL